MNWKLGFLCLGLVIASILVGLGASNVWAPGTTWGGFGVIVALLLCVVFKDSLPHHGYSFHH